jgi:hypothetical protein
MVLKHGVETWCWNMVRVGVGSSVHVIALCRGGKMFLDGASRSRVMKWAWGGWKGPGRGSTGRFRSLLKATPEAADKPICIAMLSVAASSHVLICSAWLFVASLGI